jgi:hypothetical protein
MKNPAAERGIRPLLNKNKNGPEKLQICVRQLQKNQFWNCLMPQSGEPLKAPAGFPEVF